jgi:hypothetical protein
MGGAQALCNDDADVDVSWSELTFRPEPGVLYYVFVDGYGGDAGDFVLTWE